VAHETELANVGDASRTVTRPVGTRSVPTAGSPRHFACFDGLRAIAAVSVLLLHTAWVSGFTLRSSLGAYTSRLEIGVSVFFLISGFLLYRPFAASHLAGSDRPDTRKFWERRLLRIVPGYWLALTVLTYLFHAVSLGPGWQGVGIHYFFLQIYFPTGLVTGIPQAWSLCTEMSFYLFLPLYAMLIGLRRHSPRHQLVRELAGVAALYAISFGFRYWVLNLPFLTIRHGKFVAICAPNCGTHPALSTILVGWLPSYLDLFALGMFLAIVSAWFAEHDSEPRWLRHRLMPWISWVGAAATFYWVSHVVTNHSIIYIVSVRVNLERQALYGVFAFLLLLPAVFGQYVDSPIRRLLRAWPVASLGVISYGIYLWHLNLTDEFISWMHWQPGNEPYWIVVVAVLGLSVAFASVSYFGVERPMLRFKRRISWWNRGSSTPVERDISLAAQMEPGSEAVDVSTER
jgi:peptidoglycan/LPS O-acetylase OafA/YrhL